MDDGSIKVMPGKDWDLTPGVTRTAAGFHVCLPVTDKKEDICLRVWAKGNGKPRDLDFPPEQSIPGMRVMELSGIDPDRAAYCLLADGKEEEDPWGRDFIDPGKWGDAANFVRVRRSRFPGRPCDWGDEKRPHHSLSELIICRMHVRGLTRHSSAGAGKLAGTFRGAKEKIPYYQELGVTAVELMPCYDFQEIMGRQRADGRINYWGYTGSARYFSPKTTWASGLPGEREACRELKELIRAFHDADMEVYMEFYMDSRLSGPEVSDILRFWVWEYHVDGFHLIGREAPEEIARDPALRGVRLFAPHWNRDAAAGAELVEYSDCFQEEMRRVLKGDEDSLRGLMFRLKYLPPRGGIVNYLANTNGFTMADMVSYEQRHNEANGEHGRDGAENNHTWNCGAEGPTARKSIQKMRRRQLRNAWLLLLLSQGIPLFMAGDEFGHSQKGNNNAYLQDNDISWLNWKDLEKNRWLHDFVRELIAFRKRHGVFHRDQEPSALDTTGCGQPEMSFHGLSAWFPEPDGIHRELGVMYSGQYEKGAFQGEEETFYVGFNMHWNAHELGLPRLAAGKCWRLIYSSEREYEPGEPMEREEALDDQSHLLMPPRCIRILRAQSESLQEKTGNVLREKTGETLQKRPEKTLRGKTQEEA